MANADRKHFGPGARAKGKGDGTGAMTDLEDEKVRKEDILSNRDQSLNSETRGHDGKGTQVDEHKDTASNRRTDPED